MVKHSKQTLGYFGALSFFWKDLDSFHMGVSLNGGTPKHPKMIIFCRENPWLLGTTILGKPHMIYEENHGCLGFTGG